MNASKYKIKMSEEAFYAWIESRKKGSKFEGFKDNKDKEIEKGIKETLEDKIDWWIKFAEMAKQIPQVFEGMSIFIIKTKSKWVSEVVLKSVKDEL